MIYSGTLNQDVGDESVKVGEGADDIGFCIREPSARGAEGPGLKYSPNDFLFSLAEAFACWKLRLKRASSRHQSSDVGSAFSG